MEHLGKSTSKFPTVSKRSWGRGYRKGLCALKEERCCSSRGSRRSVTGALGAQGTAVALGLGPHFLPLPNEDHGSPLDASFWGCFETQRRTAPFFGYSSQRCSYLRSEAQQCNGAQTRGVGWALGERSSWVPGKPRRLSLPQGTPLNKHCTEPGSAAMNKR